jgi:hypothetical protein
MDQKAVLTNGKAAIDKDSQFGGGESQSELYLRIRENGFGKSTENSTNQCRNIKEKGADSQKALDDSCIDNILNDQFLRKSCFHKIKKPISPSPAEKLQESCPFDDHDNSVYFKAQYSESDFQKTKVDSANEKSENCKEFQSDIHVVRNSSLSDVVRRVSMTHFYNDPNIIELELEKMSKHPNIAKIDHLLHYTRNLNFVPQRSPMMNSSISTSV